MLANLTGDKPHPLSPCCVSDTTLSILQLTSMQICKLGLNCPTSQMGRLRAEDCIAQGEIARGFGRIKGAFLEEVVAVTSFEDKHPPSRMFQPPASLGLMTGPRGRSGHFQGLPGVPAREGPIRPGSQTTEPRASIKQQKGFSHSG